MGEAAPVAGSALCSTAKQVRPDKRRIAPSLLRTALPLPAHSLQTTANSARSDAGKGRRREREGEEISVKEGEEGEEEVLQSDLPVRLCQRNNREFVIFIFFYPPPPLLSKTALSAPS